MNVLKVTSEEWKEKFSESAHLVCFEKKLYPSAQRIDYAFLAVENERPIGYVTVRELTKDIAYWQFGGSFPTARGTVKSWSVYKSFLGRAKELGCKQIITYIENTNIVMLKFAMKAGFLINGVKFVDGSVMLEHTLGFEIGNG